MINIFFLKGTMPEIKQLLAILETSEGVDKKLVSFCDVVLRLGKLDALESFLRCNKGFNIKSDVARWAQLAELLGEEIILFDEKEIKHSSSPLKIHPELMEKKRRSLFEWRPMFKVFPDINVRHLHQKHPDFGILRPVRTGESIISLKPPASFRK